MTRGVIRVTAFIAVAAAASWAFFAWRKPPPPRVLSLGAALSAHAPPAGAGSVLEINGVQVGTATAHFDQDLDEAMPRLFAICAADDADLQRALGRGRGERTLSPSADTHVEREDHRAMVRCGEHGSGHERYLYAERAEGGVSVRALQSAGPLPLIGGEGGTDDAPGSDLADVPRPRGSRRLLSTFTPDRRYGMVQLALPSGDLDDQRDAYRRALERDGFTIIAGDEDGHLRTLVAERGERRVIAVLDADSGPETIVTLLDQG